MSEFQQLIFEKRETAVQITLNRPEKRNALNADLIGELKTAFSLAAEDKTARIVILRAAGPDFCAGADLSQLERVSQASILDNLADAEQFADLLTLIRRLQQPVIAAVHGRAFAGGAGLATACDMIIATQTARFSYTEVKIGFVPAIVLAFMRRNLPEKRAFEVLTTGKIWSSEEAQNLGFVNRVVADEDLDSTITKGIDEYSAVSGTAVALTKSLLYQTDAMTFEQAMRAGVEMNAIARLTPDCQEGIRRFLGKTGDRRG
jgi:methylglutaconyl-CoA hydratase